MFPKRKGELVLRSSFLDFVLLIVLAAIVVFVIPLIQGKIDLSPLVNRALGTTTNVKVVNGQTIVAAMRSQAFLLVVDDKIMAGVDYGRDFGELHQRVWWKGLVCIQMQAGIDLNKLKNSDVAVVEKPNGGRSVVIILPPGEIRAIQVIRSTNDKTRADQLGLPYDETCYTALESSYSGLFLPDSVAQDNQALAEEEALTKMKEQAIVQGLYQRVKLQAATELREFLFQVVPPTYEIEFR